jgi:hypothetical protein
MSGVPVLHKTIVVIAVLCPVTEPPIGAPVVDAVNTLLGTEILDPVNCVLVIISFP